MIDEKRNAAALGSLLDADGWSGAELDSVLRLLAAGYAADARPACALLIDRAFVDTRQRATTARLARGKAAWNEWAAAIKIVATAFRGHACARELVTCLMTTDIAGRRFDAGLDLTGRIFPGNLVCDGATFAEWVDLRAAIFEGHLSARGARFMDDAIFESSGCRATDFGGARFDRAAEFRSVVFGGPAMFAGSHFAGSAWFRGSQFLEHVSFAGTSFDRDAAFGSCRFSAATDFSECRFADHAGFDSARFASSARFDRCRFDGVAWFSDAVFALAPSFDLARFAGTTRFDRVAAPAALNPVATQLGELRRRLAD